MLFEKVSIKSVLNSDILIPLNYIFFLDPVDL